jgi:hypothetical protein
VARRDHLIEAALSYAARGWHVFPLRPGDKRPAFPDHGADACCGVDPRCRRAGRHVTWEERATTDPTRVRPAWSAAPFGIGIAAGPSGLLVVDLDVPKPGPDGTAPALPDGWAVPGIVDGADVWCLLAERAGHPVPLDTYTVATPSGGLHLYFTAPPGVGLRNTTGSRGGLAPMIDTRAGGGYVAAPPTVLTGDSGNGSYRVLDDTPPAPLPAWLTERLTPRPAPLAGPVRVTVSARDGRRAAYLAAAVRAQLDAVTSAGEGGRNHALYMSAQTLGQLAAGGELDPADVTTWLTHAARTTGLTQIETSRTIASGLRAGARRPRTLTPAGAAA